MGLFNNWERIEKSEVPEGLVKEITSRKESWKLDSFVWSDDEFKYKVSFIAWSHSNSEIEVIVRRTPVLIK